MEQSGCYDGSATPGGLLELSLCVVDTCQSLSHNLTSLCVALLQKTRSPILIVHALDDLDIPSAHSEALFEMMCDGCEREVVHRPGWGKVTSGVRAHSSELLWYEGEHGEHNQVAVGEGVTDLIGRIVYGSERMPVS